MNRLAFLKRFAIGCAFSGMLMDALVRGRPTPLGWEPLATPLAVSPGSYIAQAGADVKVGDLLAMTDDGVLVVAVSAPHDFRDVVESGGLLVGTVEEVHARGMVVVRTLHDGVRASTLTLEDVLL